MDTNLECYKELYKSYETERLLLERAKEEDYAPLSEIIFNKDINYYYQRPILNLENLEQAKEFVISQSTNSVSFTIKIKDKEKPIPIGQIGFHYVDQSCKEIGIFYYIGEKFQKKGYAGEAACPLIRHLFENLPNTNFIKIDWEEHNLGSQKIAEKICNDILKYHPKYHMGKLIPFSDNYSIVGEPKDGKVNYFFDGFDRQCEVSYPENFFDKKNFEVISKGVFIMKED